MKFPAHKDIDPRPDGEIDPVVVGYYVTWFRDLKNDPEKLKGWARMMNSNPVLYCAVHDELAWSEKVYLKAIVHG